MMIQSTVIVVNTVDPIGQPYFTFGRDPRKPELPSECIIGRYVPNASDQKANVVIDNRLVASEQLSLTMDVNGNLILTVLSTTNPTYRNGRRCAGGMRIQAGDVFLFSMVYVLMFTLVGHDWLATIVLADDPSVPEGKLPPRWLFQWTRGESE